jgi:hypothetical protein
MGDVKSIELYSIAVQLIEALQMFARDRKATSLPYGIILDVVKGPIGLGLSDQPDILEQRGYSKGRDGDPSFGGDGLH